MFLTTRIFPHPTKKYKQRTTKCLLLQARIFWDYVRLKDITKNTGIEPNDFYSFYLKENLDNAADFQERNGIDDEHELDACLYDGCLYDVACLYDDTLCMYMMHVICERNSIREEIRSLYLLNMPLL
jgi:hypothetical protein